MKSILFWIDSNEREYRGKKEERKTNYRHFQFVSKSFFFFISFFLFQCLYAIVSCVLKKIIAEQDNCYNFWFIVLSRTFFPAIFRQTATQWIWIIIIYQQMNANIAWYHVTHWPLAHCSKDSNFLIASQVFTLSIDWCFGFKTIQRTNEWKNFMDFCSLVVGTVLLGKYTNLKAIIKIIEKIKLLKKRLNLRTHVPNVNIIIHRCALFALNYIFFFYFVLLSMLVAHADQSGHFRFRINKQLNICYIDYRLANYFLNPTLILAKLVESFRIFFNLKLSIHRACSTLDIHCVCVHCSLNNKSKPKCDLDWK